MDMTPHTAFDVDFDRPPFEAHPDAPRPMVYEDPYADVPLPDYEPEDEYGYPDPEVAPEPQGSIPSQPEPAERKRLDVPFYSDERVAARFVADLAGNLRFVRETSTWMLWDGHRWHADNAMAQRAFVKTAQQLQVEEQAAVRAARKALEEDGESKARQEAVKAAVSRLRAAQALENRARYVAVLETAAMHPGVPTFAREWDAQPHLFGVANGVVDLFKGELVSNARDFMVTMHSPVAYNPDAKAPRWEQFIDEVTCGSKEMADYMQTIVGYTLTADVTSHCWFFLYGSGANGKSTFVETIQRLIGPMQIPAPNGLMSAGRSGGDEMSPSQVADLMGKRMIVASETEEGKRLNESRIKALVSGDSMQGSQKYKDAVTFNPVGKLWVTGNHRPVISGGGSGIFRRTQLIPFEANFLGREDPTILPALAREEEGILAWAVRGVAMWLAAGKKVLVPDTVKAATSEWKDDSDIVEQFLSETCTVVPGQRTKVTDLFKMWGEWGDKRGSINRNTFSNKLKERGYKVLKTGGVMHVEGLVPNHLAPVNLTNPLPSPQQTVPKDQNPFF